MKTKVIDLLDENTMTKWNQLTQSIDDLYDADRLWNKGFSDWEVEYKYRRGGKTLCTFYAKKGVANLLITYGKSEREKFNAIRASVTESIQEIYDETEILHDGKWLWIPIDEKTPIDSIIEMLKIKRRPNKK